MNAWGKLKQASAYCGVSTRTIRKWLKQGLRHSRLPSGTIIISFAAIDQFLSSFEVQNNEVERIVGELEKQLTK